MILVDTLDTPFNEEIAESAASGSIAPRLDVPAVLARSTSRYVVASVDLLPHIFAILKGKDTFRILVISYDIGLF